MSSGFNRLVKKRAFSEDNGPDTRLIPGFGGYRQAEENRRGTRLAQSRMGHHDGAPNPKGTGPFRKRRPGITKHTPGATRAPRVD